MAALLASALAGALVGATLLGTPALAAAVVLVQVLLVAGIAATSDLPALRASGAVVLLAGAGSVAAVVLRDPGLPLTSLDPLVAAGGLGIVALAVVQLARRDGRDRLTASLTTGVAMLALVVTAATWVGLAVYPAGTAALLVTLTGVAVAVAFDVFPGPRWLWVAGGAVAAAGAGLLVQTYAPQASDLAAQGDLPGGAPVAALLAGAAGLAGALGLAVARWLAADPHAVASRAASALLMATLPVVLAAPVALAVGLLVVD
jgi:hypothetical protein